MTSPTGPGAIVHQALADLVRERLLISRQTQYWLATEAAVSTRHLSQVLAGRSAASMELWSRLLTVLAPYGSQDGRR